MPLPRIPQDALRRGMLFLLDIGVPFCVGVVLNQPAGALLGCVSGLLLSFADIEGPLGRRLIILYMVAGGMALGGGAGVLLRGFPPTVWVLFAAATFASGWLIGVGKGPMLAARFGAMALVVTSGAPDISIAELAYVAIALATVTVVRSADHAWAGPLPQQRGFPRRVPSGGWLRFALAYAAAATLSLWIGVTLDPSRVLWVVVTTLVVMQPDARTSYVLIVHRVAGTVIGVAAAFAMTSLVRPVWALVVAVLAIAALVPHHLFHRYWLHTALIVLLILLAYDLAAADLRILRGLFTERLQDVLLGSGLALIGTIVAFPRQAPGDEPE